jgi:hypothetical protein
VAEVSQSLSAVEGTRRVFFAQPDFKEENAVFGPGSAPQK